MRCLTKTMIPTWPIKSPVLRREVVRQLDLCPECGTELTIRHRCYDCNYDATPLARLADYQIEPAE